MKKLLIIVMLLLVQNCTDIYADVNVIAAVIAGEAAGEGIEGLKAVACVIQNRMRIKDKSALEIVTQKYQFSTVLLHSAKTKAKLLGACQQITLKLARNLLDNIEMQDITGGATHYINQKLIRKLPRWAREAKYIKTIGQHSFYYYRYF
jgi:spore germination cell wall hydrolase CwlJ-like protein